MFSDSFIVPASSIMDAFVNEGQSDAKVSRIATSNVNPLKYVVPPSRDVVTEELVLLEAKAIKDTLDDIGRRDPTAREHIFNFRIADENTELLRENGFTVTYHDYLDVGEKDLHPGTLTSVQWREIVHQRAVSRTDGKKPGSFGRPGRSRFDFVFSGST